MSSIKFAYMIVDVLAMREASYDHKASEKATKDWRAGGTTFLGIDYNKFYRKSMLDCCVAVANKTGDKALALPLHLILQSHHNEALEWAALLVGPIGKFVIRMTGTDGKYKGKVTYFGIDKNNCGRAVKELDKALVFNSLTLAFDNYFENEFFQTYDLEICQVKDGLVIPVPKNTITKMERACLKEACE